MKMWVKALMVVVFFFFAMVATARAENQRMPGRQQFPKTVNRIDLSEHGDLYRLDDGRVFVRYLEQKDPYDRGSGYETHYYMGMVEEGLEELEKGESGGGYSSSCGCDSLIQLRDGFLRGSNTEGCDDSCGSSVDCVYVWTDQDGSTTSASFVSRLESRKFTLDLWSDGRINFSEREIPPDIRRLEDLWSSFVGTPDDRCLIAQGIRDITGGTVDQIWMVHDFKHYLHYDGFDSDFVDSYFYKLCRE